MARQRLSSKAFLIIVVALVAAIISLRSIGWLKPIESLVARALAPIQSATSAIGFTLSRWFSDSPEIRELEYSNEQLKNDQVDLLLENSRLRSALSDINLIRTQIDFLEANQYEFVTARVIGQSTDPTSRIIYVNRGAIHGLKIDQAVVVDEGILIGQVLATTDTTAQIRVITDRQSRIAATVQNEAGSAGLVIGERGLSIRISLIPRDETIDARQSVVTSGIQAGVPRSLLIAQIDQITNEPNDLFQSASLTLPRPLDRLQIVSIITNAPFK